MMMKRMRLPISDANRSQRTLASLSRQISLIGFARFALLLCLTCGLFGCVTYIPVEEYTIARSAYEAARDAEAPRYAQALWFNAEQAYREGQKAFRERHYGEARARFVDTRAYAEQAENAARLSRHQSGQVVP